MPLDLVDGRPVSTAWGIRCCPPRDLVIRRIFAWRAALHLLELGQIRVLDMCELGMAFWSKPRDGREFL